MEKGVFWVRQRLSSLIREERVVKILNHRDHVATLVPRGQGIILSPLAAQSLGELIQLGQDHGHNTYSLEKALEEFHG